MGQISLDASELNEACADDAVDSLADDEIIDFITGERIKAKGNESVRQRIARALFHEYGISVQDMERDFPIHVSAIGQRRTTKKADIAIFTHGSVHSL
jgi:type I restriction enzyme M protein